MLETLKQDWKKLFILAMLFFMAVDFSGFVTEMPSSEFHIDHSYHITKFELFDRYGLGSYQETGGISAFLLFPPVVVPFLFLTKFGSAKLAYLTTYFLLLGIAYFVSKKIMPGREDDVMLAILFPVSFMSFIRAGRLLEFMAHLAFIPLVIYIENARDERVATALFATGMVSHLPAMLFYAPYLFFRSWADRNWKRIKLWTLVALGWSAVYVPATLGKTGWFKPRSDLIYQKTIFFFSNLVGDWLPNLLVLVSLIVLVSLAYLGREGLYALPSFAIIVVSGILHLLGIPVLKFLPGINQILIITGFPLYSYLILRKSERLWKLLVLLTIPGFLFPVSWSGPAGNDFNLLNSINGNYTIVEEFSNDYSASDFARNYLVHRGVPTPLCPVYEYSDPDWYFFNPTSCADLKVGVEYVVMPKSYEWAKSCGEYIEGETMLIVKPL